MLESRSPFSVAIATQQSAALCLNAWAPVCQRWISSSVSLTPFCRVLSLPSQLVPNPTQPRLPRHSETLSLTFSVIWFIVIWCAVCDVVVSRFLFSIVLCACWYEQFSQVNEGLLCCFRFTPTFTFCIWAKNLQTQKPKAMFLSQCFCTFFLTSASVS